VLSATQQWNQAHDQPCFNLSRLWLQIRDLVWTTSLIGIGVSAFTTEDMWVIPSLLVLLRQFNYLPANCGGWMARSTGCGDSRIPLELAFER